jgi:hypothetical protein
MNKHELRIIWSGSYTYQQAEVSLYYSNLTDYEVLAEVYRATNLYEGEIWDAIEPHLPEHRSHTALSVGDIVVVDGAVYICAPIGWERLDR